MHREGRSDAKQEQERGGDGYVCVGERDREKVGDGRGEREEVRKSRGGRESTGWEREEV